MGLGISDAIRLVRTELNFVQNRAALDGIKDAGMGFYRFVVTLDSRTTPMCRSYDGHVYPVEEASPGDNMPPLHVRCRSTICASLGEEGSRGGRRIARGKSGRNIHVPEEMQYNDWKAVYIDKSKSWKEWAGEVGYKGREMFAVTTDFASQGARVGGIMKMNKQQEGEAKIDWPKFDRSKVISKEQYRELRDFANQNGIALSRFHRFDGSVEAIREAIRSLAILQREFPDVADARHRLTLVLDDTMDANDFAMTKGRHIHLNADAYRNLDRLKEEYRKLVKEGWFVRGTDWRAIVHHEFGHIVANIFGIDLMEIASTVTGYEGFPVIAYVQEILSGYAASDFDGSETISEVFADMSQKSPTEFSKRFYKECTKIARKGW